KEWLWNEWGSAQRLTMGGAWDEAYYAAGTIDAATAWDRRANVGFRCAMSVAPPPESFLQPVEIHQVRDYAREKPVSDQEFAAIRPVYDYAKLPYMQSWRESMTLTRIGAQRRSASMRPMRASASRLICFSRAAQLLRIKPWCISRQASLTTKNRANTWRCGSWNR